MPDGNSCKGFEIGAGDLTAMDCDNEMYAICTRIDKLK